MKGEALSGASKPRQSSQSRDAPQRAVRSQGDGSGGDDFGADPCDREFDVSLTSVDMAVAATLRAGAKLRVVLRVSGNFESIVCERSNGDYVGAISGIVGLSQLAKCLREGHSFDATIITITSASVFVHVAPA